VHLVEKITRPPHFAPQFPWHSEIDFPVLDAVKLESPTPQGHFQFYGICHELGHVIAMWGDRERQEDHHAWAHYTGVTIVEHLAEEKKAEPALAPLKDARWRSLSRLREELAQAGTKPGLGDEQAVLALLVGLHDAVGPRAIGEALNALDQEDRRLRIQRVRYYSFDAFGKALRATEAGRKAKKELDRILP
jgi:hypothetical protein